MEWTHETTIDAPAAAVWTANADVAAWPAFLPTVTSLELLDDGPLRLGSRARIKQPGQGLAVWEVTRLDPGREFVWESRRRGVTVTGLHRVEPAGSGSRNTLTITMTGPFAPVLGLLTGPLMRRVLRTEGRCFAERAAALAARADH